jgi:hypothetical protein
MNKANFRKKRAARLLSRFYNRYYCIDYSYFIKRYRTNIKVLNTYLNKDEAKITALLSKFNSIENVFFDKSLFLFYIVICLFNQLIYHHPKPQPSYFKKVYAGTYFDMYTAVKNQQSYIFYNADNNFIGIKFTVHGKFIRINLQHVLDQMK